MRHWLYITCVTCVLRVVCLHRHCCAALACHSGCADLTLVLFIERMTWFSRDRRCVSIGRSVNFFIITVDSEEAMSLLCWFLKELRARRYCCLERWRLETGTVKTRTDWWFTWSTAELLHLIVQGRCVQKLLTDVLLFTSVYPYRAAPQLPWPHLINDSLE